MARLRRLLVELGGFAWWLWWLARAVVDVIRRVREWQRLGARSRTSTRARVSLSTLSRTDHTHPSP